MNNYDNLQLNDILIQLEKIDYNLIIKSLSPIIVAYAGFKIEKNYSLYKDYKTSNNKILLPPPLTDINLKLDFDYPVIVKPASNGSSIGINIAYNEKELIKNIDNAFLYSDKVIVEKFIKARELECAVISTDNNLIISTIGEITYNSKFYDYDAKYVNESKLIIPSNIPFEISNKIKEYVKKICMILNIKGLSRIDFLYDLENDNVYLMEINTMPGFTLVSMYPKLFNYDGISYKNLISLLIDNS